MKAVIMAGGEGSRLRPLTCDVPKPMTRLLGRPIIEYILDLLIRHGTTDAAVTVRYLPNEIRSHFEDSRYKALPLEFVEESRPLGTAGSVKNAVGNADEDIVVISGDALCDFDLTEAMAFHCKNKAKATLLVKRVADPREFGLVDFEKDGRVKGFVEKPDWGQAVTDCANTGIYILSPDALALIPENKEYDFAKDLFPKMLEEGMPLFAFDAQGYWCDIGDIATYISCQQDMLNGLVDVDIHADEDTPTAFFKEEPPEGDYTIAPPVYIGAGVSIGPGAVIERGTVIDDGCTIGEGAKLKGAVLLQDCYVGDHASVCGSLLCKSASVKKGASLFEGATIGSNAVVGTDATVNAGVRIWPTKQIEDGATAVENLQYGIVRSGLFDDEGISGETGVEITPEFMARVGAAIGSVHPYSRIGVGFGSFKAAQALERALIAGILSTGCQVWDFGSCFESQLRYNIAFCGFEVGVFVDAGLRTSIKVVSEGGLPANRPLERAIESCMVRGEYKRCKWDEYRDVMDMSNMKLIYQQELFRHAMDGLSGMAVEVKSSNREAGKILKSTLSRLGCETDADGMRLHLSASGTKLSVFDEKEGYIWPEKVLAVCCMIEFEKGNDVALPYDAPRAIERLAHKYGKKVLRYLDCPTDGCDKEARDLARTQGFVRDGLMAAIDLLSYLHDKHTTLSEVLKNIPDFAVAVRSMPCEDNPGAIIRTFAQNSAVTDGPREGVILPSKEGNVLLRPMKRGKGVRIVAEATSAETAYELCNGFEDLIKSKALDNAFKKK